MRFMAEEDSRRQSDPAFCAPRFRPDPSRRYVSFVTVGGVLLFLSLAPCTLPPA